MLVIENAIRQCHASNPERLAGLVKDIMSWHWSETCAEVLNGLPDSKHVQDAKAEVEKSKPK